MYVLGHVGLTALAARTLDRETDLRKAALLSLLPDMLDKPVALLAPALVNHNSRSLGHSAAGSLLALAFLLAWGARGRSAAVLWACFAGHLLCDRMWLNDNPIVALWPLLGPFPRPVTGAVNGDLLKWNLAAEAAGAAALAFLWSRLGLADPARRADLLRRGRST